MGELELLMLLSGPEVQYTYPNGDEVHNVTAIYVSRDFHGEPRVDHVETGDFGFFSLTTLPTDISPPVKPALALLVGRAQ